MRNRIKPQPGQESVWDYPRPPRLEKSTRHLRIVHRETIIVDTNDAYRVLETSHPPVYYVSPRAVAEGLLVASEARSTFCEFKGQATYWDLQVGSERLAAVAWSYPQPSKRFEALKDYLAFYPSRVDACFVNDERVQAQAGDFYGGWITSEIVGPFKGGPGTWGW